MNLSSLFNEHPRVLVFMLLVSLAIILKFGIIVYLLLILLYYIFHLIHEEVENLTGQKGVYEKLRGWLNGFFIFENSLWMDDSISPQLSAFEGYCKEKKRKIALLEEQLDAIAAIRNGSAPDSSEYAAASLGISRIENMQKSGILLIIPKAKGTPKEPEPIEKKEEPKPQEPPKEEKPKPAAVPKEADIEAVMEKLNREKDEILEGKSEEERAEKKEEKEEKEQKAEGNTGKEEAKKEAAPIQNIVNVNCPSPPAPKPPATSKGNFLAGLIALSKRTTHPVNYIALDPEIRIRIREYLAKNPDKKINFIGLDDFKNTCDYLNRFKLIWFGKFKKPKKPSINLNPIKAPKQKLDKQIETIKKAAAIISEFE